MFLKNSFRNTIRVSNSLDPDQAGHFVRPDLGPNCLQRLSADDIRRQSVKGQFKVVTQWNTIRVSNSLDPDQGHFIRPDLGPNCLHRLSAEDTRRQRVKGQFQVEHQKLMGSLCQIVVTHFFYSLRNTIRVDQDPAHHFAQASKYLKIGTCPASQNFLAYMGKI